MLNGRGQATPIDVVKTLSFLVVLDAGARSKSRRVGEARAATRSTRRVFVEPAYYGYYYYYYYCCYYYY